MRLRQAKNLRWGTYGKGALERYLLDGTTPPPMKIKPLGDCDTDHLEAILRHVTPVTHGYEGYHEVSAAVHLMLLDRRWRDRGPTPWWLTLLRACGYGG